MRRISSIEDLRGLSDAERDERARALAVISLARRRGIPIRKAASEVGVPMPVVREWASDAVAPSSSGVLYARREDRIPRGRPLYVEGDLDFVLVEGSREAALATEIFDAQWAYILGESRATTLEPYRGVRADGRLVETDPEVLKAIAYRGDADPVERYRELLG